MQPLIEEPFHSRPIQSCRGFKRWFICQTCLIRRLRLDPAPGSSPSSCVPSSASFPPNPFVPPVRGQINLSVKHHRRTRIIRSLLSSFRSIGHRGSRHALGGPSIPLKSQRVCGGILSVPIQCVHTVNSAFPRGAAFLGLGPQRGFILLLQNQSHPTYTPTTQPRSVRYAGRFGVPKNVRVKFC